MGVRKPLVLVADLPSPGVLASGGLTGGVLASGALTGGVLASGALTGGVLATPPCLSVARVVFHCPPELESQVAAALQLAAVRCAPPHVGSGCVGRAAACHPRRRSSLVSYPGWVPADAGCCWRRLADKPRVTHGFMLLHAAADGCTVAPPACPQLTSRHRCTVVSVAMPHMPGAASCRLRSCPLRKSLCGILTSPAAQVDDACVFHVSFTTVTLPALPCTLLSHPACPFSVQLIYVLAHPVGVTAPAGLESSSGGSPPAAPLQLPLLLPSPARVLVADRLDETSSMQS